MSDPMDLPTELQHLIEKRENEKDRRQQDAGPPVDTETDHNTDGESGVSEERRRNNRRETDQE